MKILHVTREQHSDKRYGLGRSVAQLLQGLQECGDEVESFCAGDLTAVACAAADERASRWAAVHGQAMLPILTIISNAWQTGIEAAQVARQRRCTHVHCHDAVVSQGYVQGCGGTADLPWGLTQHGFHSLATSLNQHVFPLGPKLTAWMSSLETRAHQDAGWSVFLTELGAAKVDQDLGLNRLRPNRHVVGHGKPAWLAMGQAQARHALGLGPRQKLLLAVGQLVPLKRLDWIIHSMQEVGADWRLIILGEGDAQPLLSAAQTAGVAAPMITANDEPQSFYAAADVFVSASATESFGMAHLEAMCSGLPIACTAVGGVPEVVADAARLLPDDRGRFVAGLVQFLAPQAENERAALAARAALRSALWPTLVDVGRRYQSIYRSAV